MSISLVTFNKLLAGFFALLTSGLLINPAIGDSPVAQPTMAAKNFMVAAAHPLAVKGGYDVLKRGGNAIDAMVVVQTILGLVEPQSSGLGGGAFLVYWDNKNKRLTTFDGREAAPLAATPQLFQDANGKPLKFMDAVVGGRSVGVPGTLMLINKVHERYGRRDWPKLLEPATKLARDGFKVQKRLARQIAKAAKYLKKYPQTFNYFFDNAGNPLAAGAVIKNPKYAATLKKLAKYGSDAYYYGDIASEIVEVVQNAADNPGLLTKLDFSAYKMKERPPVCVNYRGYDVCGMGPPSSGALTVGQILKLVEPFDLASLGPDDPQSWRIIGDASRLAFADRARYMADIDFVPMPKDGLIDQGYLSKRSRLLQTDRALENVEAGNPGWSHASLYGDDDALEYPSTTHFVITDKQGNIVSMTSTIENYFGSCLMAAGFLLNNELTDFSFASQNDGVAIANRVEPGKRPRSSMSPTIIFKDGKPVMAIGSPGGSRIIGYVAQAIIAVLDWGMDISQAVSMLHRVNRYGDYELEIGAGSKELAKNLTALGYQVKIKALGSGLHGIIFGSDGLTGASDPRIEGAVMGD